jgi:hypothetical protein
MEQSDSYQAGKSGNVYGTGRFIAVLTRAHH